MFVCAIIFLRGIETFMSHCINFTGQKSSFSFFAWEVSNTDIFRKWKRDEGLQFIALFIMWQKYWAWSMAAFLIATGRQTMWFLLSFYVATLHSVGISSLLIYQLASNILSTFWHKLETAMVFDESPQNKKDACSSGDGAGGTTPLKMSTKVPILCTFPKCWKSIS